MCQCKSRHRLPSTFKSQYHETVKLGQVG